MKAGQFEGYLNKVFDLTELVESLPEPRQWCRQPFAQIFRAVLLGTIYQLASLHRIEAECRQGVLARRVGQLSEDALAYALARQDPEAIFALGCLVARRLKRNGVLASGWARGRVVVALDGMELFGSTARFCSGCLERRVKHQREGVEQESTQYYHRVVVAVVVSSAFPIPLGLRFVEPGHSEPVAGLALIEQLKQALGRRFFDVLVADALYLSSSFVRAIERWGLEWVMPVKENQPELLAEAQRATQREADGQCQQGDARLRLWCEPQLYWARADRSVTLLKVERVREVAHRVVEVDEQGRRRAAKHVREQRTTSYYASNIELGLVPAVFLYRLGASRWVIDAELFQQLTTQAHIKRASIHQQRYRALVVLTRIRLLAFTLLLVFYHRQVHPRGRWRHCGITQLARLLAYAGLAAPWDPG